MMPCRAAAFAALISLCSVGCMQPQTPERQAPYAVRLVGASDAGLRGHLRGGWPAFSGQAGRDYAIEVVNFTSSDIGFMILIDGLDAKTGDPVTSCVGLGGYTMHANGRAIMRGFPIGGDRIASYRFAPADRSLAASTAGARRESIGTIEVCIFSLRPLSASSASALQPETTTFAGTHENAASAAAAPVIAEVRAGESSKPATAEIDSLLSRLFLTYEDEEGHALGTAPPPPDVHRASPASPTRRAPTDEPPLPSEAEDMEPPPKAPQHGKPPKGTKAPPGQPPPKPTKQPYRPKPDK